MISVVCSLVVALVCIAASLRRLEAAVAPTALDPAELRRSLTNKASLATLRAHLDACGETSWELDLLDALSEPDPDARDALVDVQVHELGWLVRRWARVPRVCASISASSGGFFGTLTIILAQGPVGDALTPALDSFALGVFGAAVSGVVLVRAREAAKARAAASERLVDQLCSLAAA